MVLPVESVMQLENLTWNQGVAVHRVYPQRSDDPTLIIFKPELEFVIRRGSVTEPVSPGCRTGPREVVGKVTDPFQYVTLSQYNATRCNTLPARVCHCNGKLQLYFIVKYAINGACIWVAMNETPTINAFFDNGGKTECNTLQHLRLSLQW